MSGRSEVDKQKIVIFGAGKIGRSFIGQLFGCAGYQVVFVDVNQTIVDRPQPGWKLPGCH